MEELLNKWEEILNTFREQYTIPEVSFKTWILPIQPYSVDGDNITLVFTNSKQSSPELAKSYVEKRYLSNLEITISEILNRMCHLRLISDKEKQKEETRKTVNSSNNAAIQNLNPAYVFDTFVIGNNNNLAHAASLAVAESPGQVYNPLFIYGGVGLGKTHLMQAIAHYIIDNDPSKKVLYVTSEQFINELINSIKDQNYKNALFRNKYRNLDVLLIDDIQFIAGKKMGQEEFFHTFNTLRQADKQIIISSDKPPRDIPLLEERIKTRLEWGILADISLPDYETRLAILRKKVQSENIIIDDYILSEIAEKITSNIRELEGALNKIVAYASLTHSSITIEIAEKAINDIVLQKEKVITSDYIQEVVAKYFNIDKKDLTSSKKSNDIVYPRQIAMYLCRTIGQMSLPKIGQDFGNRDHTTVMHAVNKIEKEMKEKTNTKLIVESVKNIIQEQK